MYQQGDSKKDIELPLLSKDRLRSENTSSDPQSALLAFQKKESSASKLKYFDFDLSSRVIFAWITTIINKGNVKAFQQDQHYDLRNSEKTEFISESFASEWEKEKEKSLPLLRTQYATFKHLIWRIQALAMIQTCFDFAGPVLVGKIISYISSPQPEVFQGIFLIFAFLAARVGVILISAQTVLNNNVLHQKIMIGTRSLLYKKFLIFPLMRDKEYSTGSIMNHMLVDVDNNGKMFLILPQLIQFPIILTLGIYMIYTVVGTAFIAGIIAVVSIALLIFKVNNYVFAYIFFVSTINHHRCQKQVMSFKDARMKKITEILTGIKYIKMCGVEDKFFDAVNETREVELGWLRKKHLIIVFRIFLFWLSPILLVVTVLGGFLLSGQELTPQKAFTVLSTLMIVQIPINHMGQILNDVLQGQVSLTRLNKFLFAQTLDSSYITHHNKSLKSDTAAVRITNGSFYWTDEQSKKDSELILKNINMEVKKGSFVAILGDVGSGKSSLFNCLMAEMTHKPTDRPSIEINGSVAYAAQKPWIVNATIKENILFYNEWNEQMYKEAVRTSCLQSDLKMLIKQDETEIGEKGVNLSGGQKARVALARAIYANSDIYLLDDPLSAVDAHVGKFILQECLTGLLREKTRILVTHKIESLKYVDYIYIFKAGEIVVEGNYNEVKNSPFYQEIEEKANREANAQDGVAGDEIEPGKLSAKRSSAHSKKSVEETKAEEEKRRKLTSYHEGDDQKALMDKLMLNEDRKIGSVGLETWVDMFKYFGTFGFFTFIMTTITMWVLLKTGSDFWLAYWSNNASTSEHGNGYYYGIYATLGIASALVTFLRVGFVTMRGIQVSRNLHNQMLLRIIRAPINLFFDRVPIGRLINRFASDLDLIDTMLPFNFGGIMHFPVNLIARFVVCCFAGTLWALPLASIFLFIGFKVQRRYLAVYREVLRLISPVVSTFAETLEGLTQIRSSNSQEKFLNKYYTKQNEVVKNQILLAGLQGWFQFHINLASLLIIAPTITAAILFSQNLVDSPGLMGLLVTYLLDLSAVTINTLQAFSNFESQLISFERCRAFTNVEVEAESRTKQPLTNYSNSWPLYGQIEFKNYYAKYRPNLPYVLKDVSFKIRPSEKIGIVGRTGSGKSTLLLSLLRIIEAQQGQIQIDGVNTAEVGLDDLRRRVTIIPQDPLLYKGSLRSNLDLFGQFSDAQLWKALEKVCMKNKFVDTGLETDIKEGGENLSAGEKQLLCIARAILNKTKIVLVDEATSSIDNVTEETILESIRENFKDCTMITIAHRLKTIIGCDRILFMDQGKVAEFDTPKELLKNKNGHFYGLWKEYESAKA